MMQKTIKQFALENFLVINIDDFSKNNHFSINNNIFMINLDHNNNLLINILDNIIIAQPIYLINHLDCNFNIIINSGKNSKLTIIDHKNHQNNTTNLICDNNTIIDYYLIQATDNSKLQITQNVNSIFHGKLLSNNLTDTQLALEINLLQPNATAELHILQNTKQKFINSIDLLINHLTTNSSSLTVARSIAHEQASIALTGKIMVHKCAAKTQAALHSKSLILSPQASIISCPELVINNNDVICTHGSSVGNLDANALFYMQTRGINLAEATKILLQAFLQPIIHQIKYQEIIDYLQ